MTNEQFIASRAKEAILALYNIQLEESELLVQTTKKEFEGDYTLVIFPLLKKIKGNPEVLGQTIGAYLQENVAEISAFNVVKGFLNLSLSGLYWNQLLSQTLANKDFGKLPSTGKKIMIEFSSPNTNKPLHLGHIRNNLLGAAVANLLSSCGHQVIKSSLINDRGIHICKSMLAWELEGKNQTPESAGKKGDHLVGDYYVAFNDIYKAQVKKLVAEGMSEEDAKKEAPAQKMAREMLLKWEQDEPQVKALWHKMNDWVLKGFDETYKNLGISFDKLYFESQTYLLGKELVSKGLEMGVFEKETDGSIWCDLTADGLDRKLLLRGDGTSVYITQDLGTAERRFSEDKLDSHIYVVGNEQNYHFQVLKLILAKLGFDWAEQIYHLSYGMVELPEGKMKSREGTVVDADDLIEKMIEEAKLTSEESGKLNDMSEEEKALLYKQIGLAALKYFILKVDPKKTMLFNPKESIDFNGNTGPFIQYTYARIRSIGRKAAEKAVMLAENIAPDFIPSAKEIRLIKFINLYPEKILEAGEAMAPSIIANYVYDLAKEFNQYYHDTPILKEENQVILQARLLLIAKLAEVLQKAMALLGIELPERM